MKQVKKFIIPVLGLLFLFLFCYFRLKPIIAQSVIYTYDQGRDFLKVAEIVRDKDLTFIGPTTGIAGIYHGPWWYYLALIPFILSGGHPNAFYIFVFFTSLLSVVLFALFIKKEFGVIPALLFFGITTISPYFTSASFNAINTTFVLPFVLLFIYSLYRFFKAKDNISILLLFTSLGFIFEFEVAAGFFFIPAFVVTILLSRNIKTIVGSLRSSSLAAIGFLIPLFPRILFEAKNNFAQTKTAINFATHPTQTNTSSFTSIFTDRIKLFWEYYLGIFPEKSAAVALIVLSFAILGLFIGIKSFKKHQKAFAKGMLIFLAILFGLTLAYRNNFFWANYLEGIPYIFLIIIVLGLYGLSHVKNSFLKRIPSLFIVLLLGFSLYSATQAFSQKKPKTREGLKPHILTVEKIYEKVGKKDLCVRIYTPPVIPYTYDYLFDYYSFRKGYKKPGDLYINRECWYIIEEDVYEFRIKDWRDIHIPKKAKVISKEKINNTISIELWKLE